MLTAFNLIAIIVLVAALVVLYLPTPGSRHPALTHIRRARHVRVGPAFVPARVSSGPQATWKQPGETRREHAARRTC
jgi:hypothetical protein